MRSSALVLGLALASSAMGGVYRIESSFPTDQAGNPTTPRLGEPFWMTIRYVASSAAEGQMVVSAPWQKLTSPRFATSAGQMSATYGPITPLTDGAFPISVSVGDSAAIVTTVNPQLPSRSIEYYDPLSWRGSFRSTLSFKPGSIPAVTWLVPRPETFGFQQVAVVPPAGSLAVANGVFQQTNPLQAGLDFWATSSAVRINPQLLKTAGFADLKRVPKDVSAFTKSEALIESGDKTIKNFVAATLPKKFDKTMSVFDAAKVLYQATIARINYVRMDYGQPSAVWTLRNGYGDCGYFSSLFVAACRQAGIPARPIAGFLEGQNEWHVWAEFYVPNAGWVPVDPSFADGLDPQGTRALYFGVIPNLNRRVATSIGFDHTVKKNKAPMLQSPMAFTTVSRIAGIQTQSSLSRSTNP